MSLGDQISIVLDGQSEWVRAGLQQVLYRTQHIVIVGFELLGQ